MRINSVYKIKLYPNANSCVPYYMKTKKTNLYRQHRIWIACFVIEVKLRTDFLTAKTRLNARQSPRDIPPDWSAQNMALFLCYSYVKTFVLCYTTQRTELASLNVTTHKTQTPVCSEQDLRFIWTRRSLYGAQIISNIHKICYNIHYEYVQIVLLHVSDTFKQYWQ